MSPGTGEPSILCRSEATVRRTAGWPDRGGTSSARRGSRQARRDCGQLPSSRCAAPGVNRPGGPRGLCIDPDCSGADFPGRFRADGNVDPFGQFFDLVDAVSGAPGRPIDLIWERAVGNPCPRASINRPEELVHAAWFPCPADRGRAGIGGFLTVHRGHRSRRACRGCPDPEGVAFKHALNRLKHGPANPVGRIPRLQQIVGFRILLVNATRAPAGTASYVSPESSCNSP